VTAVRAPGTLMILAFVFLALLLIGRLLGRDALLVISMTCNGILLYARSTAIITYLRSRQP